MSTTLYHNPRCSTSRQALALLREHGIEPIVVDYLKTPFTRDALTDLITRSKLSPRAFLRSKEALYQSLQLDDLTLSDDEMIEALLQHPVLFNRPVVANEKGVRIGRPVENILELL
ncbi:MAG: arsenate reductase (glutaredoxin) [Cardiobacteriaceae bacterium]|nr:arsenate reductase (glutaredoxin) [Cardiobacteriaceae bacterium]